LKAIAAADGDGIVDNALPKKQILIVSFPKGPRNGRRRISTSSNDSFLNGC
jgi:hypothetical protein